LLLRRPHLQQLPYPLKKDGTSSHDHSGILKEVCWNHIRRTTSQIMIGSESAFFGDPPHRKPKNLKTS
jgi:hypothetical protein